MSQSEFERKISASLLRLRMKSPFFATLALFAPIKPTDRISTAVTDGQDIFVNPDFARSLSSPQLDGLLLHEVLHAALLHVIRRGTREPARWNVAADIVVNGMIAKVQGFELTHGGVRDPKLEHLSVEEIYELLLTQKDQRSCQQDLLDEPLDQEGNSKGNSSPNQGKLPTQQNQPNKNGSNGNNDHHQEQSAANQEALGENGGSQSQERSPVSSNGDAEDSSKESGASSSLSQARRKALEAHWRNAMQQAIAIARSSHTQGTMPLGAKRELEAVTEAQLDWRSYLWRYLVRTPTDFSGFDRRFIGRRLYLEALEGESVTVYVAIDTSGSIGDSHLQLFLSELQGILSAYPHLKCELYYADADVYGPYEIQIGSKIPPPVGGGGTSFVPFFDKVSDRGDWFHTGVCVYLTDGYGNFPIQSPFPTLWVVTPGGLDLDKFPFGEAVRLLGAV